jgi:hypothetical protein
MTRKPAESPQPDVAFDESLVLKDPLWHRPATLIIAGVVVLSAIIAGLVWYLNSRTYPLIIVNGMPRPYTVKINDQLVAVGPEGFQKVYLKPGMIRYSVSDFGYKIEDGTYNLKPSDKVVVINPDRTALLIYHSKNYQSLKSGPRPQRNSSPPGTVQDLAGEPVYELAQVDYLFEQFPHILVGDEAAEIKWRLAFVDKRPMRGFGQKDVRTPNMFFVERLEDMRTLSEFTRLDVMALRRKVDPDFGF